MAPTTTETAFTIKILKDPSKVTDSCYDRWFTLLDKHKVQVLLSVRELDSKGVIHYHGILQHPKSLFHKRIRIKGFSTFFKPIHDRTGWIKYCNKDIHTKRPRKIF